MQDDFVDIQSLNNKRKRAIMNTRPAIESSNNPLALSVSFNQDSSCFSVGLDTGFCSKHNLCNHNRRPLILSSLQLGGMPNASVPRYEIQQPYHEQVTERKTDFNAGIGAAQMLGKANYIALIGGGKQPKFPQNKVSAHRLHT